MPRQAYWQNACRGDIPKSNLNYLLQCQRIFCFASKVLADTGFLQNA